MLQNGDSSHVLRIFDDEAQAMQSARNSSLMLDDAYNTGVAILTKYADQRDRLKVNYLLPELSWLEPNVVVVIIITFQLCDWLLSTHVIFLTYLDFK